MSGTTPLTILVAGAVVAWAIPASQTTPASKGADSNKQTARGEAVYLDECARCHSETLTGTEFGPALVGREYAWLGRQGVSDMFVRVRTMPIDGPDVRSTNGRRRCVHPSRNLINVGDQPLAAARTR